MIQENFKKWSYVTRRPVFPSSRSMLSRDKPWPLDTWNTSEIQENVFDSPRAVIDSSSTPYQGMLHSWNQSAIGGNPVRDSTGKPVARCEERNRETIPTPRFERRPSTMTFFFPGGGTFPQNYVAGQQRLQISELQFDKFTTPSTFSCWKIKIQSPSKCLFQFTLGDNVKDQSSGDGRFGGAQFRVILISRILRCWMPGLRLL